MTTRPSHLTGRLVLSAWIEIGHEVPLRVRITDVRWLDGEHRIVTVTSIDEAVSEVRDWLERLRATSAG
jgi:hypothetical protein